MFASPSGFAERKMPSSLQSIAYPRGQVAMSSCVPPMRYAEGRYIPPLTLVFRALTPVLGVLTPVADDPSSGASVEPEMLRLGWSIFGLQLADPGLPGSSPKL